MMLFNDMHRFVLLFAVITLVCSWSVFGDESGPGLDLGLSSQPVDSSTNSSILTDHTIKISKIVNTTLGVIAFLFTFMIYFFLMRYTLASSNEIVLPSKFLADNIGGILSSAWPVYMPEQKYCEGDYMEPWTLLLKYPVGRPEIDYRDIMIPTKHGGSDQPEELLRFRVFSPAMKSLIQIAVWNSASFWILSIAITNTLVYNGFFTNSITTDGIIRLLLIGFYAVANIAYQIHGTTLLYRNFSSIIYQACWGIVCEDFMVLPKSEDSPVLMAFTHEILGTTQRLETYKLQKDQPRLGQVFEIASLREESESHESSLDKFIKPQRETELKAYEKAAESALDRTLANVAVLVGICLAGALAPWTSPQASSSTSAQLGSYALLLSISTGLLALVGSMGHLINATESTRKLLEYQECSITSDSQKHRLTSTYELSQHLRISFPRFFTKKGVRLFRMEYHRWGITEYSLKYPPRYPLTLWGHWRSIKGPRRLIGLFLGPVVMLVPRTYGMSGSVFHEARMFHFTVKNLKFSYDSISEPRILCRNPNVRCLAVRCNVPDQAGARATGDGTEMGTDGLAHEETDKEAHQRCEEDERVKQVE